MKTVVVLGATPKTDRYAFRAMQMLKDFGHRPIPVNPAFQEVLGETCYSRIGEVEEPIDTITLYLGAPRSTPLIEEILAAKPRRIIMNPGAENDEMESAAKKAGVEVVHGCTLIMLQAGQF